jgi:hypothetical protein
MFGIGFLAPLKKVISIQDNTIRQLRDELIASKHLSHHKQLELTRVSAENASLKIRINNFEEEDNKRRKAKEEFNKKFEDALKNSRPNTIQNSPPEWATNFQIVNVKEEKPPINPKLQAYYNRGKNNPNYKSKRKPKNKKK